MDLKVIFLMCLMVIGGSDGRNFDSMVPGKFQRCCSDSIPDREECKEVDAAVTIGDQLIIFAGNSYVTSRIRDSSHFPEILYDQSVKTIDHWDFGEDPDRFQASEVDAAYGDDRNIFIKKGTHTFRFRGARGKGEFISCNRNKDMQCFQGTDSIDAEAQMTGINGQLFYLKFRENPLGTQNSTYQVDVDRGREPWMSYVVTEDRDRIDAISIYKTIGDVDVDSEKLRERFKADDTVNYGVYFNTHGYACFFKVTGRDLETGRVTQFERPAILKGVPMVDCMPSNVFFGCPQSFCFRSDVDDFIVTQNMTQLGTLQSLIVVYRGHYFWTADVSQGVPILPAESREQILAESKGWESFKNVFYIDAAEAFTVGLHHFIYYFIDDKLIIHRGIFGDTELHSNIPISSTADPNLLKPDQVSYYEDQIFSDLDTVFPERICGSIDTMFYNVWEMTLYMFCGPYFQAYDVAYSKTKKILTFKPQEINGKSGKHQISDYFDGLEGDLDASLSLQSQWNATYVTKGQYYWKIPSFRGKVIFNGAKNANSTHKKFEKMVSFGSKMAGPKPVVVPENTPVPPYSRSDIDPTDPSVADGSYGLFDTQKMCGYSNDQMIQIKQRITDPDSRSEGKVPKDQNVDTDKSTGNLIHAVGSAEESETDMIHIIRLVAGIVAILAIIGLGCWGCCDHRSDELARGEYLNFY